MKKNIARQEAIPYLKLNLKKETVQIMFKNSVPIC
jgi:hypothetical protein